MSTPFILFGASHWHAPWHFRALTEAGQRVVAIHDADIAKARALAGDGHIATYADWRDMLASHPDAIGMVLTRPDETPALLDALIIARMRFVLEKPGTRNGAELRPIFDRAAAEGVAALVPFVNRDMAFWTAVAPLRASLGDWTYAHFHIIAGPPDRYVRDGVSWVLDADVYGGGALRNLGIHAADAALSLANGAPLTVLQASLSHRLHGLGVEDFAQAALQTADGRVITIEAGYAMPTETTADKQWRIHGPGWAVSEQGGEVWIRTIEGLERQNSPPSSAQYAGFGATMAEFAAGRPVQSATLADLMRAQDLVDAIYAAATTDR
ncbi:MAG: Gfo/Idh/MocA family protein [Devosia sp.]